GEFGERDRPLAPDAPGDVRREEGLLGARLVMEAETRLPHREARHRPDEMTPVGAAAELAVGHRLEAQLLLQAHRPTHRLVLRPGEAGGVEAPLREGAEGRRQLGRAQQAADVLGAERRAHVSHHSARLTGAGTWITSGP